jgi:hypothetical protein
MGFQTTADCFLKPNTLVDNVGNPHIHYFTDKTAMMLALVANYFMDTCKRNLQPKPHREKVLNSHLHFAKQNELHLREFSYLILEGNKNPTFVLRSRPNGDINIKCCIEDDKSWRFFCKM